MKKEELIKEQRTFEAMKKGYTGLEGKFGVINQWLGDPIISQGSDQTYLSDPYNLQEEGAILTADFDESTEEIGTILDGLKYGMNLSIWIKEFSAEIIVRYKGQVVYREEAGELEGFAPYDEWESCVEKLYDHAKKIELKNRPIEIREMRDLGNKLRKQKLEELRLKWGI
jgi:hypothetical protein